MDRDKILEAMSDIRHSAKVDGYTEDQKSFLSAIANRLEIALTHHQEKKNAHKHTALDDKFLDELTSVFESAACHQVYKMRDGVKAVAMAVQAAVAHHQSESEPVAKVLSSTTVGNWSTIRPALPVDTELYSSPQPAAPQPQWIKYSDLPISEADEDCDGAVWWWNGSEQPLRCPVRYEIHDVTNGYWMPTGLQRPEPPEAK